MATLAAGRDDRAGEAAVMKLTINSSTNMKKVIKKDALWAYFLTVLFFLTAPDLNAQRLSRELNVDLWINQAGYVPAAGKTVVTKGLLNRTYEVIRLENQQVVFTGRFTPNTCDFGDYSTGDFSAVTQEGHYYIKSDTLRSWPFQISETVYRSPIDLLVGYFSLQRCGPSTTGYLAPCHLDDGVRLDNGKHQDVTGGWHDATDLRKWVNGTIPGMIGLSRTYELLDENDPGRETIYDELLWGNRYFLNMQEPQGFVMYHIGGEVKKAYDSNRWTDNEIGEEGGELHFVRPTAGALALDTSKKETELLIFGTSDDRVIQTEPADLITQYHFIASEAVMARLAKHRDPAYSERCLQAALRGFAWCQSEDTMPKAGILGASMQAAVELYKATGQRVYRDFAAQKAALLKKLQADSRDGAARGFFYTSLSSHEPYRDSFRAHLELIALCDLVQTFPRHGDAALWKKMIKDYSVRYLSFFSRRNSFGVTLYGLYAAADPGGNRKIDQYWYRYFMPVGREQWWARWWVGLNPYIALSGVGLIKAAAVLDDPALKAIAQRQLDWIVGANPFGSSAIVGVGYNQPPYFQWSAGAFRPATPVLPGAVSCGPGGSYEDRPHFYDNAPFGQSEYWTPAVAYALWLMAEISKTEK
jgi:hypothetical protein